jgi:hypothetical protein
MVGCYQKQEQTLNAIRVILKVYKNGSQVIKELVLINNYWFFTVSFIETI